MHGHDDKIIEILNDEIHHSREYQLAMETVKCLRTWGKDVDPPERITKEEVQEMIDDAIRKHNRNASIISMCVGWVVLALFAEGLLRLIGVIDPLLPWLNITL